MDFSMLFPLVFSGYITLFSLIQDQHKISIFPDYLAIILAAISFSILFSACVNRKGEKESLEADRIQAVLRTHRAELMSVEGVVGTAVGEKNGKLCINVFVRDKTSRLEKDIPSSLEGFEVMILETGDFKTLERP